MDKYIYGGDTETHHGKPLSMQFYSEDCACDEMFFVNESTATDTLLKWCSKRRRNVMHVVYVHMLSFDLPEFLWEHKAKLIEAGGEFQFKIGKWSVRGLYGTPTFCSISNGHDITVQFVDSFSYFRGSLAKGAELYCPDLPKLKRPQGLGEKRFTKRDSTFCDYAMRDAVIDYHIGKSIERLHQTYDLQQCVSIADLAARVFRHKFLRYEIPQPSREIVDAAVLSYHGGKNNITVPAGWYEDVTSIDISSAYPDAMRQLPAFSNEKLYRRFRAGKVKEVPDLGIYFVRGTVAECDWPVIFSHGFKPLHGKIDGVCVQGYELNEALRSGELQPTSVRGWYYDGEKDHQAPGLRNFVDHFYKKKDTEKDPVIREQDKLILNSVSGKLIQTRKKGSVAFTDVDADVTITASELVAGGLFMPFMASAVTAHTRARIHRLEHHYEAIHTATDGILSQKYAAKARLVSKRQQNDLLPGARAGIGKLTIEAEKATALILRNKCYIIYTAKSKKTQPSKIFPRRHIRKWALHGFQGNVTELEKLVATGRRTYEVTKPWRLKQALKMGVTPNEFVKRQFRLKIGPLRVISARAAAKSQRAKQTRQRR